MERHIIAFCFLAFYIAKMLDRLFNASGYCTEMKQPAVKSKIIYLVNGNEIHSTHVAHANEKLKLTDGGIMTHEYIEKRYYQVFDEIVERRKTVVVKVDIRELRAAKYYLFDRWNLLSHLN
ncbi:MAG: hypothetical protein ABI760_05035 [Ferruginibacter sp.]